MSDIENMQLFENQPVRTAWNEEEEEWYFSVVDVIGILTDQPDSRRAAKYWSVLKIRLKAEGNELTTNCSQLKLKATDGKRRLTDVANTEQLLRIIQSIPSKKAEPFKLWLARVGRGSWRQSLISSTTNTIRGRNRGHTAGWRRRATCPLRNPRSARPAGSARRSAASWSMCAGTLGIWQSTWRQGMPFLPGTSGTILPY